MLSPSLFRQYRQPALTFLATLVGLTSAAAAQNAPGDNALSGPQRAGLRITGTIDNGLAMIPVLKVGYATCVMNQQAAQAAWQSGPTGRSAVNRSRAKGHSITANPVSEPDWDGEDGKTLGKGRFEEYFSGNRYAKYEYRTTHDFSNDGRCRLQTHHSVDITIDTGQVRYAIALHGKKNIGRAPGTRHSSRPTRSNWSTGSVRVMRDDSALAQEAREDMDELRRMAQENPEAIAALMGMLLGRTDAGRVPGVGGQGPGQDQGQDDGPANTNRVMQPPSGGGMPGMAALNELTSALQYSTQRYSSNAQPRASDYDVIAGQPCDKVMIGLLKSRACYWHRMHYYETPAGQKRPIVLLVESGYTRQGERSQISYLAESFNWNVPIDDLVFQPGDGLARPGSWSE